MSKPGEDQAEAPRRRKSDKAKFTVWKYFGAMLMEQKGAHMAMSLSRFVTLILALFCLGGWSIEMFFPDLAQLPQDAVYSLWAALGLKGSGDVAARIGRR